MILWHEPLLESIFKETTTQPVISAETQGGAAVPGWLFALPWLQLNSSLYLMKKINIQILILFISALYIVGCMDADPFGLSTRTIANGYYIKQWEDGRTYLFGEKGKNRSSYTDKIIEIGWNENYILLWINRHGEDIKWLVIDISSKKTTGPFTDEEIKKNSDLKGISPEKAETAWGML